MEAFLWAKRTMKNFRFFILPILIGCSVLSLTGCGPTYPKNKIEESIIKLCKNEYKIDIKVKIIEKMIAIYLPLEDLIDFTFMISKTASEKINDVILSVSRVTLSTDAEFNFYCIIAHDVRIPEIQIVVIKSVDDVKRFMLNDISRTEYAKRMLVDIRLNPQAQKERTLKEVLNKMSVDAAWQDKLMNDFFRSEPTALSDIGYWNDRFYIKDISWAEFLAEQIANRIKFEFKENKELDETSSLKSAKGAYGTKDTSHYLRIEILADRKWLKNTDDEKISENIFKAAMKVAYEVIHGYKFEDFDYVEILNQANGKILKVSKDDLKKYKPKKEKIGDMMELNTY